MTTIAVIGHPPGDEEHPIKPGEKQKGNLRRALCQLDRLVNGKRVAVLASSAKIASSYAKMVAGHFMVDLDTCEGLLRDPASPELGEGCDCIEDYLDKRFGLVVVIVATDIAMTFALTLSKCDAMKNVPVHIYPNLSGS